MSAGLMLLLGVALAGAGSAIAVAAAAVSRLELARWIARRLRGAAIASALLSTPGRLLGAANAVATAGLVLAAMGGHALLASVSPLLRSSLLVLLLVPALIVVTYVLPRALARRWPERVVQRGAPIMEYLSLVISPLLPAVDGSPRGEVRTMLDAGKREGVLATDELTVFSGVVAFAERTVREVMTPRTEILAVPDRAPPVDVARLMAESGYSRLPVYRETLDNIVGMVYAFDILKDGTGGTLPLRPVTAVPATKRCADLLVEMQREHRQFAVVLDEFGGTAGIATFEDLLEELVGEIFDEHDVGAATEPVTVTLVEVDGSTAVSELAARLDVPLPGQSGTVGGMLARAVGRIPQAGERFVAAGLEFDILAATPTKVERVAVRRGSVAPTAISVAP